MYFQINKYTIPAIFPRNRHQPDQDQFVNLLKKNFWVRKLIIWIHFTQNFMLIPNLPLFPCLLQYFGRYMPWKFEQNPKNAIFRARFTMVTVFFGPNQLVLVKTTPGRYGACMLGSVSVGASMYRYHWWSQLQAGQF